MNNLLIKRIKATIIDVVVVAIPFGIVELVVALLKLIPGVKAMFDQLNFLEIKQVAIQFMVFYFIYDMFYNIKFRTTIGKNIMKIHVETNEGSKKIPRKNIAIRSLIKSLSLCTLYAVPAAISVLMMTTDYGTSLQDKIARTNVWENMVG